MDIEHCGMTGSTDEGRRAKRRPEPDRAAQQRCRANAVGVISIGVQIEAERPARLRFEPSRHPERELGCGVTADQQMRARSEEHTSELQSLMRISYAVFCLKKKKHHT